MGLLSTARSINLGSKWFVTITCPTWRGLPKRGPNKQGPRMKLSFCPPVQSSSQVVREGLASTAILLFRRESVDGFRPHRAEQVSTGGDFQPGSKANIWLRSSLLFASRPPLGFQAFIPPPLHFLSIPSWLWHPSVSLPSREPFTTSLLA